MMIITLLPVVILQLTILNFSLMPCQCSSGLGLVGGGAGCGRFVLKNVCLFLFLLVSILGEISLRGHALR